MSYIDESVGVPCKLNVDNTSLQTTLMDSCQNDHQAEEVNHIISDNNITFDKLNDEENPAQDLNSNNFTQCLENEAFSVVNNDDSSQSNMVHASDENCNNSEGDVYNSLQTEASDDTQQDLQLWKCPKCVALFCDNNGFAQHFEESHNFVCGLCQEPCEDKSALECHIIDHVAQQPGESLQKIKKRLYVDSSVQTESHVNEFEKESAKKIKLDNAEQDDDKSAEFSLEKGEPEYECEVCKKQYYSESAMFLHMKSNHGDMPVSSFHQCNICGMFFQFKIYLAQHKSTKHSKKTEKSKFYCKICKDYFISQEYLKLHEKTHADNYRFICDFCDEKFRCSAEHLKHLKSVHPDSKEFPCAVCEKSFKSKMFLNAHALEVHSSDEADTFWSMQDN